MTDHRDALFPLLKLERVGKTYGKSSALSSVSIDVAKGEFLTIVGPSGSGKSTLLAIVAGFSRPDSGRVVLDGKDITNAAPELRQFGVVPQGYVLFPHLSVWDNVAFPLRVRGAPQQEIAGRVQAALDLMQISLLRDRSPAQLSGGQQQRAALARALVFEPKILLLDEPMSALDASLRRDMQQELVRLHRHLGITFVHVTHDQEEALSLSDRIVVLKDGAVAQIGRPQDVYLRPHNEFVAQFLGRSNLLRGSVDTQRRAPVFRWNDQILPLPAGDAPYLQGSATLVARPERIRPTKAGHAAHGGGREIRGKIVGQSFHGGSVELRVSVQGQTLTVDQGPGNAGFADGDEVLLDFDRDGTWLLPQIDIARREGSSARGGDQIREAAE